jgi:hypothetical protein
VNDDAHPIRAGAMKIESVHGEKKVDERRAGNLPAGSNR